MIAATMVIIVSIAKINVLSSLQIVSRILDNYYFALKPMIYPQNLSGINDLPTTLTTIFMALSF
jgi:hypothetical protein